MLKVTSRLFTAVSVATAVCSSILVAGCSSPAGQDASEPSSSNSEAISTQSIANVALANVGKGACTTNSKGGQGFDSSCHGNGGSAEYWCADFARWAWAEAGANTAGLTAAAGSFYVYGQNHGTLHSSPRIGDAVVFNYKGGGYADHVAIVVRVNSNNTIETVSGDWGGHSGSEAEFSITSRADLNAPAYPGVVGSYPGIMGMRISGFISPAGAGNPPPSGGGCYSNTLGREMPSNACVQSRSDDLWYQCDNGRWVDRWNDPTACNGVHPL
jgi:hypothetical protein